MRKQFWKTISELAKKDKSIIVLVGDLGYSFMEPFAKKYPKQFINCGIIEQSMVDIASGLAMAGKKPYVYSATPFLLFRAFEQVRDDIAYNNTNVKLIGTGASQFLGFTHNIVEDEDLTVLSKLPNIKTFAPYSPEELDELLKEVNNINGPVYVRI